MDNTSTTCKVLVGCLRDDKPVLFESWSHNGVRYSVIRTDTMVRRKETYSRSYNCARFLCMDMVSCGQYWTKDYTSNGLNVLQFPDAIMHINDWAKQKLKRTRYVDDDQE